MKNGEQMTKDILLEFFDVKKTSPLFSFVNDLTNWIIGHVEEQDIKQIYDNYYYGEEKSIDEMIECLVENYRGIEKEDLKKIASEEYRYYEGCASDDSGGLEYYLCETGINIDTDTIKIKSGGSY
jgi:hypothetical protein